MEFVIESSGVRCQNLSESGGPTWSLLQRVVVSIVVTCQRVVGPCGVCYREWSGVCCRDLLENSGRTTEAQLGRLVEQNSSLSQQSKRSLDVFEVVDGLTIVGCLRH